MNITVRFRVDDDEKSPVSSLLKKLTDLDVDIIEAFNEADRVKASSSGPTYRDSGDVASSTASIARGAVQNGN